MKKILFNNFYYGVNPIMELWNIQFHIGRQWCRLDTPGWRVVSIGVFKIHTIPEQGGRLQKKHYRGFRWMFLMWFPFDQA